MKQHADPRGPEIPGYQWSSYIGRGGSADVHRYRQQSPDREVAIKVLRPRVGYEAEAMMRREANVLAQVSNHPGIVSLFATGRTRDGATWMALELCQPPRWQRGGGVLPVAEVLRSGVVLAGALATLHGVGIVHRDVKPSNVLVSEFGGPVLTDFGIAGAVGMPLRHGEGGLSIPWAAPEVHMAQAEVGSPQDVFSLAATLWTWLSGASPFEIMNGDNSRGALIGRVMGGQLRSIGRRDVPPGLEEVLRHGLAREASQRPSAADFGRMLQRQQRALGLPETELEIRQVGDSATARAAVTASDDPDATRLRPVAVVSSDTTSSGTTLRRSFEFSEQGSRHTTTGQSISRWDTTGQTTSTHSGRRGPSAIGIFVAVFAGVLVAGALLLTLLLGGGWTMAPEAPQEERPPVDAVSEQVPSVRELTVVIEGDRLVASWQAPDKLPATNGAHFGFTISRAGEDEHTDVTDQTSVSFPAVSGSNCIEVWTRGAGGAMSKPQQACVTN